MQPKIASESWSGAARPGRDLARFGASIFIAAGFSAVQVFVIPRALDIATYGQYRLFLVYVGFVGILNFGLADGAFLRWAGMQSRRIAGEWRLVLRWLVVLHLALIGLAALASVMTSLLVRTFVIGLALCALCSNVAMLAAYALQTAGDFRRAGYVPILTNGAFVGYMVVARPHGLTHVLAAFIGGYGLAGLYGTIEMLRRHHEAVPDSRIDRPDPATLLRTGTPVLGANLAAALTQSADRLLVSAATPIASFALYGFASTATVAASAATQALSRVALSHAGRRAEIDRATFLAGFYDVVAAGFGAALLFVPLFEHLVSRSLPVYAAALPILRALIVGLPFWVAIHVVLVGTLQAVGHVRSQFVLELTGMALVVALSGACILAHQDLWVIAGSTSIAALATFGISSAVVRRIVGSAPPRASLRFAIMSLWQGAALIIAMNLETARTIQFLVLLVLSILPTAHAARRSRKHGW